ncbi:hypothetical protein PF002_g21749 [Phytophthora fragariae]|uniref:Uncharacterized protein n=1 Tax=Phytophthora fragariae TaxID=53985 RepID=A0A6A3XEN4_9STRA|nr:hypothetical protein PF002_g21749 [Phytophthora fragariae]
MCSPATGVEQQQVVGLLAARVELEEQRELLNVRVHALAQARTHVASLASLTARMAQRSTWMFPGVPRVRDTGRHNTLPGSSCNSVSLMSALNISLTMRTRCFFMRGSRFGRGRSLSTRNAEGVTDAGWGMFRPTLHPQLHLDGPL